jgi:hypothetical protein
MTQQLVQFGISNPPIVWIFFAVLSFWLWRKMRSLRATVKTLQNQVDQLKERNLSLTLKTREHALDSASKRQPPQSESADVLPLKSSPIAPSLVSSR